MASEMGITVSVRDIRGQWYSLTRTINNFIRVWGGFVAFAVAVVVQHTPAL